MGSGSREETGIQTLLDMPAIEEAGVIFQERGMVALHVEPPLVPACEHLYDLRIRSVMSSANAKDIGSEAHIILDYDTMSLENQAVADAMEAEGVAEKYGSDVRLNIPVTVETSVREVSDAMLRLTRRFSKQPLLWSSILTKREVLERITNTEWAQEDIDACNPRQLATESSLYWVAEQELFYESEDHYRKIQEDLADGLVVLE